jgi:15-cis-phytoene synthase
VWSLKDELDAAGIRDPLLRESFRECRRLNAQHGKTYFLATLLLPPERRPHVHALYGFARYADEIVDDLSSTLTAEEKRDALERWGEQLLDDLRIGESQDLIGRALVYTAKKYDMPHEYFRAFLRSMAMDLTIHEYQTFDDLMEYVYGSAVVIGLEMLPILGVKGDRWYEGPAFEGAKKLGTAFQLANFIRDIGEDLDRDRIYLPTEELQSFGVTYDMMWERKVTTELREALKYQIARVHTLKREAEETISFLDPISQPCIKAASELYCGIVDEVEKIDYQVFTARARTSTLRRARVAIPALLQALGARVLSHGSREID